MCRQLLQFITVLSLVMSTPSALGQEKLMKILVGVPPGGTIDLIARLLSERLRDSLGRPVTVINRTGAQTRIAVRELKSSPPDGSTLLVSPGAIVTIFPHTFRELGYDPFKDLAPVAMVAISIQGIAVPHDSPVQTLAQLIEWARANPKGATFATSSTGSTSHFLGMLLGNITGARFEPVGFRGAADAVTALAGNHVSAAILGLGELVPAMQSGKVRVLATFGETRAALLPEIPTMKEAGFAELQSFESYAVYAPGGTPESVIDRLNKAVIQAADPAVRERITKTGLIPRTSSAKELEELNRREFARWRGPVKASGYVAD